MPRLACLRITRCVIRFRSQNQTHAPWRKVPQFAPNASRNRDAFPRTVQRKRATHLAVVDFYLKTARNRKYRFMTSPMSMSTACLTCWYV